MRKIIVQSLTAYTCRICMKYSSKNLLIKDENNKEPMDLEQLLQEFFQYIRKCKIDKYTNKAFLLNSSPQRELLDTSIVRIHIQPNAGKALENFSVVNYNTNELHGYKGENYSAVYAHNILIYIRGYENVFVFHHYGQSGCKTAFLNTFNDFLDTKGLKAHLDVLLSKDMFNDKDRCVPEKLSLITTYSEMTSDKADNVREKENKKIEQETIISLNAPRAARLREWFRNSVQKKPTIDELKSVLIKDDFTDSFEDAKLTLKFGKVRRRISFREFTGVLAEYDVTEKLEICVDGTILIDSLYSVAGEYAVQFFSD